MAKTIAIMLRKGGSGKTTTAVNLAAALRQMGKRVLLVDLDPQANATIAVGIDPTQLEKNISSLLTDINTTNRDVIVTTDFALDVLPAHPDLALAEAGMNATQVGTVKQLLQDLQSHYDYIIIDTPPSEGYLTINSLVAADEVIIPLQAHFLAMQGLQQALNTVAKVQRGLNPNLKIVGILPTMVNPRTNIARIVLKEVGERYSDLLLPYSIDYSIRHAEASLAGLPIVLYDPEHNGSKNYKKLARKVL
jgi:chromosome partitioning protein